MPAVPLLAAQRASRRCCTCLLASNSSRPAPPPSSSISASLRRTNLPASSSSSSSSSSSPCRFFRATPNVRADVEATKRKNHYERLGVRHDASASDIKRSFYRLSKTHHPDANPSDPSAADRFSLLSESYTLLSDPSRRATYDRDVLRLHGHHHHGHGHQQQASHPKGSYSSAQAGGRSPSGLSRRRTTFRGPPPSFYRSGGWGNQTEKRQRAHDESTGFSGTNSSSTSSSSSSSSSHDHSNPDRHAGMGPGADPFSHTYDRDIPHFDRAAHRRTHEREDVRRGQRQRHKARRAWGDDGVEFEPQMSLAGHFIVVSGILGMAFLAPFLYLQVAGSRRRKGVEY